MRTRWIAAATLVVAGLGCSTSGTSDAGSDSGLLPLPSPALDPLVTCTAIAKAQAVREVACRRLAPPDFAVYVASQCPSSLYALREAAHDAGKLAFDAVALNCYLQTLGGAANNPPLPCNSALDVSAYCSALGWGRLPAGATCDDPLSCGQGLYCQRSTPGAGCGICTADAQLNDGCGASANGAACAEGYCVGDNCRMAIGSGQNCDLSAGLCPVNESCLSSSSQCGAPLGVGAACQTASDCQDGLACSPGFLCAATVLDGGDCSLVPCDPSSACVVVNASDGGASDGGDAGPSDGGARGATCVPFVYDAGASPWKGAGPCAETDAGVVCPEFEVCRNGACTPGSLLGGSCGGEFDCAEGACVDGGCALLPAGAPCQRGSQCANDRCDIGNTNQCAADCKG